MLRPFVQSLLQWSDCAYRLVSNGCARGEAALLEALCAKEPRLSFFELSREGMLKHAAALNRLQAAETSDHFCFLDSDILATGPFLGELTPLLGEHAAVFSGRALWSAREDQAALPRSKKIRGNHNRAGTFCAGSTFFAIYDNRKLAACIRRTGIAFDRFRYWERVPEIHRPWLVRAGLKKETYDTGKLLNLLLQAGGEKIVFKDSPHLVHIGGLSKASKGDRPRPTWRELAARLFDRREAGSLKVKEAVSRYFTELLISLDEGRPFGLPLPSAPGEIRESVRAAARAILEFHGGQKGAAAPDGVCVG
jgi:hypothetical protein